jgi:hypothetical protein
VTYEVALRHVFGINHGEYDERIPSTYFELPTSDPTASLVRILSSFFDSDAANALQNHLIGLSRVLLATKRKLQKIEEERQSVVDSDYNLYREQLKITEELQKRYNSIKAQIEHF